MAKMTKHKAFKRLQEAQQKVYKVMLSNLLTPGEVGQALKITNDIGKLGKKLK
tara:strand:+ start:1428 stop:1586 length:159 start_codon:yes stop_codon:yes gene_type:complete